jgi:hypothetical protein
VETISIFTLAYSHQRTFRTLTIITIIIIRITITMTTLPTAILTMQTSNMRILTSPPHHHEPGSRGFTETMSLRMPTGTRP